MNKFDLHVHTLYSPDGREKPEKIAKFLKKMGFSGMAITDHDTMKGVRVKIQDFIVIPGEEIKTEGGHILAIGISEEIKTRETDEAIEEIHEKGGIAIIAHPFRFMKPKVDKIDAVEVINGRSFPGQNEKAKQYALKKGLPFTAGSDGHFLWEFGRAYTIMDADSVDDVINDILKGKTIVGGELTFFHPIKTSIFSFMDFVRRGFKRV